MVSVLFVCLGNICRSPMAEAVFRDMVKKEGLESDIKIDSAATSSWEQGNPVHPYLLYNQNLNLLYLIVENTYGVIRKKSA